LQNSRKCKKKQAVKGFRQKIKNRIKPGYHADPGEKSFNIPVRASAVKHVNATESKGYGKAAWQADGNAPKQAAG